jgi:hypothetical protein
MRFAALAAVVLLAPAPALAAASLIEPGWWETTNTVLSPLHSSKTEQRCIGPAQVAKFMEGPGNHIYRCTYPTRVFRDGQIHLKGTCKSRDGAPFPIAGEGTYSRDSFHLDARASAPLGPISLPVHAATDAHRLADACPTPPAETTAAPAGNGTGNGTGNETGNAQ